MRYHSVSYLFQYYAQAVNMHPFAIVSPLQMVLSLALLSMGDDPTEDKLDCHQCCMDWCRMRDLWYMEEGVF
jgi:hypothetical protein